MRTVRWVVAPAEDAKAAAPNSASAESFRLLRKVPSCVAR